MTLTLWTANIANSPKDKEDFNQSLKLSTKVLDRLRDIVEEKKASIEYSEHSSSSYKEPSWACYQAHLNGKRAAYTEILQLLNI